MIYVQILGWWLLASIPAAMLMGMHLAKGNDNNIKDLR